MKLSTIRPNPKNPRVLRDDKFQKLKKSIEDFPKMMELRPIVVDDEGVILGGNMRFRALQDIYGKNGEIPDAGVKHAEDLTEEEKRQFVIKDNAAFGEWDWDMLANEWDAEELAEWGIDTPADWGKETKEVEEDDFDADKDVVETVCKRGDIFQLGDHRLMCGDSTDAASVALLMDGQRADICFTSPPYNMQASDISQAFTSKKVKDTYGIKDGTYKEFSDNLTNEQYTCLLSKSLDNSLIYCDNTLFNVGILKGSKDGIVEVLHIFKDKFCDILIWNKDAFMPLCLPTQKHLVGHICELIFCFNNEGDRTFKHSQWELGKMHNRIDTRNAVGNEYSKIHHATFPVELPFYIIQNFTDNSVLDLFGETGTTMIAAEQLGRKCYMMELDPHYCDVIIARWEKLTGKKAEKIN